MYIVQGIFVLVTGVIFFAMIKWARLFKGEEDDIHPLLEGQ